MRIIFVRHGTTVWNVEGRLQGRANVSLTEEGRREALSLARDLAPLGIEKIWSSDLARTKETAQIIARELRLPLSFDKRLRECSFGRLEGQFRSNLEKQLPDPRLLSDSYAVEYGYDYRPYGGENQEEVLDRHEKFIDELVRESVPDSTVLIVGHGRGLNTLLFSRYRQPILNRGEYRIVEVSASA